MNSSDVFGKINNSEISVVYFSFPECSVCKSLRPKIESLVGEYENVEFLYVDTHELPTVSGQYLVFTVPTVILFQGGKEQTRWSRVFSVDEVRAALSQLVDKK